MVDYYDYIKSVEWLEKTEDIRNRNGGLCECCNMRYGSDVHHRTYDRLGNEKGADLIHLCRECHSIIHNEFTGDVKSSIWPSRIDFLRSLWKEANEKKSNA